MIADLAPIRREVRSRGQRWYDIRLRPYRTVDDKIDGVVISFIDVTDRRKTEDALRESEERLRQEMRLVELSSEPIFIWNLDDGIVEWNRGSEELYGWSRQEALGRNKEDLLGSSVPESSFADLKQELIKRGSWSGELGRRRRTDAISSSKPGWSFGRWAIAGWCSKAHATSPSASVGRAGRRRWFANSPTA